MPQRLYARFALDLDAARTLAKRTNVARTVSVTAGSTDDAVVATASLGRNLRFGGSTGTTATTFLPPDATEETVVDTYPIVHRSVTTPACTIRVLAWKGASR